MKELCNNYTNFKRGVFSALLSKEKCLRTLLRSVIQDHHFSGGPVVKNLSSNEGDTGSIPRQGTKIPHAAGLPRPRAATTEPAHSGARVPQLERSPHAATKTQCSQINK